MRVRGEPPAGAAARGPAHGREVLRGLFGDLPSVFTPPWNRCALWTAEVLRDLGFTVLSRDLSAGTAGVPVCWFADHRRLVREGRCRSTGPAGVSCWPRRPPATARSG